MLAPGAIVDPEDLRIPGEQPGTPIVVLEDLGEVPHGQRFRARQGKSLLLLTALVPDVTMQRELRDLLSHRIVQSGGVSHPNLLPTYGCARLPLGEEGFDTLFIVRPDPGCPTLRQWLHEVWQAGHALDPLNAVAITVQVCEALAVLHEKFPHGYVTADNVFMYPTGGMPQALLSGTGEGSLLPFAPGFDRFAQAGYLPQAGRELFEPPHEPRVETDVLGAAALVLEILTGQPLEPGMPLERFGLPPRLQRILEVASRPEPDERPQDILMFSRRLQAAVGLGEDPTEPTAVLEPVHHGDHADPRYPAVRAHAWRPPPPAPPPWVAQDTGPTQGSGAWNIGAPTPGSGAWNIGAPTPGSGAWNRQNIQGAPPGSGGPAPGSGPGSGAWNREAIAGAPPPAPSSAIPVPMPRRRSSASWQAPGAAPAMSAPPAFGRGFPMRSADDVAPPTYENNPGIDRLVRPEGRTKVLGAGVPPPPVPVRSPPPAYPAPNNSAPNNSAPNTPAPNYSAPNTPAPNYPAPNYPAPNKPAQGDPAPLLISAGPSAAQSSIFKTSHSVSIMMPAPDGSMMAPLSQGPANFVIVRHAKRHGPYDLAQLERLIPMGKLRSVDAIEIQSSGERALAVDLPGLRPLFEARAQAEQASMQRSSPPVPVAAVAQPPDSRGTLWTVIGLLALGLVAVALLLALS